KNITLQSETEYHPFSIRGNIGLVPEGFPAEGVGYMYFHDRDGYPLYGISYTNGSMGIGSCIENNTVITKPCFMEFINDLPFYIGLIIIQLNIRKFAAKFSQKIFKGFGAVYFGLPLSEKVKVGPVDDNEFHVFY